MFRKGKALGEQGFYEKAVRILEEVKEKSPSGQSSDKLHVQCSYFLLDGAAADAELTRLRIIDNERTRENNKKLKGMIDPFMSRYLVISVVFD